MLRRERVVRRRLERVQSELADVEGVTTDAIENRMQGFVQALEWVLREREQDTKPPLGSEWRADKTVTGRVAVETALHETAPADSLVLAGKSYGQQIELFSTTEYGQYHLLHQPLNPDIDVSATVPDVELDIDGDSD